MANRLINEQSPYLLQHAHNPVDWYPWGDAPFERAKQENKPVLVSIGYAACHWCHVMEHESFENETVAAYMNEHFICIKVDREEHPDVDHIYMDAVQAISGSGGWPLNAFVTPERVPFYGGTYFPPGPAYNRPSWMQLLERMHNIWTQQQDEVGAQAEQMLQYLKQASQTLSGNAQEWDMETCKQMAATLLKMADKEHGGFGRAPKFPGTMAISYLLEHYHYTKNEEALAHATHSLDAMIKGGIYDQLGGGFARYSTDDRWLAPHFEKMLYDNALLVCSLCDAYAITKAKHYKVAIQETIAFAERELREPTGGYYSALDADSEGVEGKFYTWTWEEWEAVMGDDELLAAHFGVEEKGNWEHTNILHIKENIAALSNSTGLSADDIEKRIIDAKEKLLAARGKRIRPLTDDKSLLSWNALMNIALTRAATVLQDDNYRQRVTEHMDWMLRHFVKENELLHVWKNGEARIAAKLDDYAYLVQAMIQLAGMNGNEELLVQATAFTNTVISDFGHENGNFFYFTSARQQDIPVRKVDLYDGALPSANAVMAHNLLLLGMCMERSDMSEQAAYMLQRMADTSLRYTYSFAYWAQLLQRYAAGLKMVMSVGEQAPQKQKLLQEHISPHCYFINSKKDISVIPVLKGKYFSGETLIFVCTQRECLPPDRDIERVLQLISL